MATHRYWRLRCDTWAGGACYVGELEMRTASGGTNLSTTGNGTASSTVATFAGGAPATAFDATNATYWKPNPPTIGMGLQWDFGAGNERDIRAVTITNMTSAGLSVLTGGIEYSDNGSSWTQLIAINHASSAANYSAEYIWLEPISCAGAVTMPMATLTGYSGASGTGTVTPTMRGYSGGSAAPSLPQPFLTTHSGANVALTAPMGRLRALGGPVVPNAFAGTIGFSLEAYSGAVAPLTMPKGTLQVSGTVGINGSAAVTLPAVSLSADGVTGQLARAQVRLSAGTLSATGGANAALAMASPAIAGTATTGAAGHAALRMGKPDMDATGSIGISGQALLFMPTLIPVPSAQAILTMPLYRLEGAAHEVVAVSYEAYAVNLKPAAPRKPGEEAVHEVTRYTNFPFNQIVRWGDQYFGVADDGLYLLEGTTDVAAPVAWSWTTCLTDFKKPNLKTPVSAYYAGRMQGATLFVYAGEGQAEVYDYDTTRELTAQNHRQKFGRGIKARYFAFGASGAGELALDSIEFNVADMARRIYG